MVLVLNLEIGNHMRDLTKSLNECKWSTHFYDFKGQFLRDCCYLSPLLEINDEGHGFLGVEVSKTL